MRLFFSKTNPWESTVVGNNICPSLAVGRYATSRTLSGVSAGASAGASRPAHVGVRNFIFGLWDVRRAIVTLVFLNEFYCDASPWELTNVWNTKLVHLVQ